MGPILTTDVTQFLGYLSTPESFLTCSGLPLIEDNFQQLLETSIASKTQMSTDIQSQLQKLAEKRSHFRATLYTVWQALRRYMERKDKGVALEVWSKYAESLIKLFLESVKYEFLKTLVLEDQY
jgi:predicted transcriptional regulator